MTVNVSGEAIQVDPHLLFQRLTMAGSADLEIALQYELCTFPPALFESSGLLNEALYGPKQDKKRSLFQKS